LVAAVHMAIGLLPVIADRDSASLHPDRLNGWLCG
jgi:hypothetical protein